MPKATFFQKYCFQSPRASKREPSDATSPEDVCSTSQILGAAKRIGTHSVAELQHSTTLETSQCRQAKSASEQAGASDQKETQIAPADSRHEMKSEVEATSSHRSTEGEPHCLAKQSAFDQAQQSSAAEMVAISPNTNRGLAAARQVLESACLQSAKGARQQGTPVPQKQLRGSARQPSAKKAKLQAKPAETFEADAPGVPERLGDQPLRLIIIGTNPSGHAWRSGHYYSNPNNWMWRILKVTGLAPASIRGAQDDERMPGEAGVGFLDLGCGVPGTQLSSFSSQTMQAWAPPFFGRLAAHMQRASHNIGCSCGSCGAPAVVAFAGKRQWMEMLNVGKKGKAKLTSSRTGPQNLRPEGWPFPSNTEVWVLPSTSGAAPMTTEERIGPWQLLAAHLESIPWPRQIPLACGVMQKREQETAEEREDGIL